MQQGNIGITSENIFPIIKKFLYSDSDIFIREIISNAVDAIKKLQVVSQNPFTPLIQVHIDTNLNTITVKDNGIGMDADEIEKYINQIAFSGASDFLAKYKDAQIIGHFGLGFYSSFMVSDKVEIITKSYKENAVPQHWTCEGTPSFSLEDTEKETVGTDIVMHINEQYKEYLDSKKIIELLNTYNKFTGIKIEVSIDDKDAEEIEAIEPLWTKKPSELTDDDYLEFYRKLYPEKSDPLYWLHLNVDFPFNLSGILYFPSIKEISVIDKSPYSYDNGMYLMQGGSILSDETECIPGEAYQPEQCTLIYRHELLDGPYYQETPDEEVDLGYKVTITGLQQYLAVGLRLVMTADPEPEASPVVTVEPSVIKSNTVAATDVNESIDTQSLNTKKIQP